MQGRKKSLLLCFAFVFSISCHIYGNDSILIHRLVQRLTSLQIKNNKDFSDGIFPSFRNYQMRQETYKNDDNIFFTALIIHTLKQLLPYLSVQDQLLCKDMFVKAMPAFKKYKNRNGFNTYNFWQTETPKVFPNGGWLNLMNKSETLPDDLDDTSIILMATDAPDSVVQKVHQLMQKHSNCTKRFIKNTFPKYKNIPAYSTWFGDKMPIDFDVCVLSNILCFVQGSKLSFTKTDSASVYFIQQVIANRHYLTAAPYIAPHYAKPSIILYHFARLMEGKSIPELEKYRSQLIADTQELYTHENNFMNKIILATALMRWGADAPEGQFAINTDIINYTEQNDFNFFIANMASMLPNPFKRLGSSVGLGLFNYYCPAYNDVLLLEYLVWKKRFDMQHL
jgi:hypothetical protein